MAGLWDCLPVAAIAHDDASEAPTEFWCAYCDAIKPMAERSNVTNHMGLMFCEGCADEMHRLKITRWGD